MKKTIFSALLGLLIMGASFNCSAADPVVIGQACTVVGTSTMTTDEYNIATCLKNETTGTLVWKGMTTSSPKGTLCGAATRVFTNEVTSGTMYGDRSLSNMSSSNLIMACNGTNITNGCPKGYTLISLYSTSYGSSTAGATTTSYTSQLISCASSQ